MPQVICPDCKGGEDDKKDCERCHGTGTIWVDSGSGW
jgi:DnaJ-class molecular chaperone